VQPFVDAAARHDRGLFVLALTSNPGAGQVQHARTGERTVAGTVLAELAALNAGATPLGSYGAVVGATIGETTEDLAINGPLLAPGVGAQGGTPEAVARIFGDQVRNVVPSSSREILAAGPGPAAIRDAAARTNDAFRTLVG
jgi:orotidine-5'-phosphate decarboxylase